MEQRKLREVQQEIVQAILPIFPHKIYKILVYGSYARGDFNEESDLDIMVIVDCPKGELLKYRKPVTLIASRIGLKYDIMVSILLRDKSSFSRYRHVVPFYDNVANEGVEMYG